MLLFHISWQRIALAYQNLSKNVWVSPAFLTAVYRFKSILYYFYNGSSYQQSPQGMLYLEEKALRYEQASGDSEKEKRPFNRKTSQEKKGSHLLWSIGG